MYSQEAVVNNQVGLHARPATFFIQKANEFKSSIWVEKDERKVNAKSLWACSPWVLSKVLLSSSLRMVRMRRKRWRLCSR